MSLLSSFSKKPKLTAAHKHTAQARKSEGGAADALYSAAYSGYADVLLDDPMRAEALYSWGFALLHQAKSKSTDEAVKIYQDAISKFTFCMLINPDYLGSAINMGVAYMDMARLLAVTPDNELYDHAQKHFENANRIQKGTASYNLACICALRGDQDGCLKALQYAQERGSLPDDQDILDDADLDNVKTQQWFIDYVATLEKKPEPVAEAAAPAEEASETPAEPTEETETAKE
ncbi:hypothetical protein JCM14076_10130 [Methylosoma difficile]